MLGKTKLQCTGFKLKAHRPQLTSARLMKKTRETMSTKNISAEIFATSWGYHYEPEYYTSTYVSPAV